MTKWRRMIVLAGCVLGGCAGDLAAPSSPSSPPTPRPCELAKVKGSPSDFINVAGAKIDPPVTCGSADTFIRVHGSGKRKIVMGRPAFDRACHAPPPADAPADACPEVFADDLGKAIIAKMAQQAVASTGLGLGVCGNMQGDYVAWNFSVAVESWRDVDTAVAVIAAELDRWGAGGSFGVSVRATPCPLPVPG